MPTPFPTPKQLRLPHILTAAWLLCMIAIPIVLWTLGEAAMQPLIGLSVLLQASAVLTILFQSWSWQSFTKTAVFTTLFTFTIEYIGSHTGLIFGHYHYTPLLQPQLSGVPLLIPLAWLMMLPCAWATAAHFQHNRWLFVLLSSCALTAWDLLLDPQMVGWGLWVWDQPGGYFGIPWQNYLGWLLTACILTAVLTHPQQKLPLRPLLTIYTITWFLETFGLALFWGMPGPALVGGLAMGSFVLLGWWHIHQQAPPVP